jgi:hypothetical protein
MHESKLSTKLEKLREDIEKQNDIIADSEKKLTRLDRLEISLFVHLDWKIRY